jgi:catechol 2,3-dioxygenase-like lactoylglutathione lyase family enzyme
MASVRYIVNDVTASVEFYTQLGFKLEQQFGLSMAIVTKDDLTLWLAGPQASASKPMPDGTVPKPGGWNRFVFKVDNIEVFVVTLKSNNVKFKNEILRSPGGAQVLIEDPSGNVIEVFQPT